MAGTKAGAKKASETMKKKYGSNWYCKIGSIGGKAHVDKGFACMPFEKRSEAGRKGGLKSKRGKKYDDRLIDSINELRNTLEKIEKYGI